jgi:hypothetical protein
MDKAEPDDLSIARLISIAGCAVILISLFLPWSTAIHLLNGGTIQGGYSIVETDLLDFLRYNSTLGWSLGMLLIGGTIFLMIFAKGKILVLVSTLIILAITLNQHYLMTGSGYWGSGGAELNYGILVLLIGALAATHGLFLELMRSIKADL